MDCEDQLAELESVLDSQVLLILIFFSYDGHAVKLNSYSLSRSCDANQRKHNWDRLALACLISFLSGDMHASHFIF